MRLEPEAVDVLGELDAEIGALEIGAEHVLDVARHPLVLEGLGDGLTDREILAVFNVEIFAGVVVQLALARNAVERGGLERKRQHIVDAVSWEAASQYPVAIGLLRPLRAVDAFHECLDDIFR